VSGLDSRLGQAAQHLAADRLEQARAILARLVQEAPDHADANNALAIALFREGKPDQALYYARRALAARPGDPDIITNAARILGRTRRVEDAIAMLRAAAADHPQHVDVRGELACLLVHADRLHEAAAVCREALAIMPANAGVATLYAAVLRKLGRIADARDVLREAQWRLPDDVTIAENLAGLLCYDPDASPREVAAAHLKYGSLVERYAADIRFTHPATDDPDRPLRVGLVGHEMVTHSVSYFAEPILEHLDRSRFDVTCYHTGPREDATTARWRTLAARFRSLPGIDSVSLARRIHHDRIDLLIELSGLQLGHRLHAMQLRPAPLQFTCIGYATTTGLRAIDFRIVDSVTDPPGADAFAAETLLRLDPCFLCYRPPPAPPVAPRAADEPVTFGSFNAAMKINDRVIETWSRVLAAVPGSRLVLKAAGFTEAAARAAMASRLAAGGIDPARAELLPQTPSTGDHLALYSRIDVALDTFPYNGTTTTCEALLMGVPVVTLAGATHAARVGASLLTRVGLADLVAPDAEGYISIAAALAADAERRRSLRSSLRTSLLASPLCDGPAFGRRLGEALRDAWRRRCRDGAAAGRWTGINANRG
jgi:predicted O-linked N-acetylglucosamine transferase (SPINDLY family)